MELNFIKMTIFKIKKILTESDKAWLVQLLNDQQIWISKKYCNKRNETLFEIPLWLEKKIKDESSK